MEFRRLEDGLQELANAMVPTSESIWPLILAQVKGTDPRTRSGPVSRGPAVAASPRGARWRLAGALGVMLLIVAAAACAATPLGRAAVLGVIERFGFVLVETNQLQPSVSQTANIELAAPPVQNIEEVQSKAPFHVPVPAWLPPGLTLLGGSIYTESAPPDASSQSPITTVFLRFGDGEPIGPSDDRGMSILIGSIPGPGLRMLVPALSSTEDNVSGVPAVCVKGAWDSSGDGDPNQALGTLRWNTEADHAALSWERGELAYSLWAYGLGLECDDLIHVAESLR